jgi:hypothetical protein
MVTKNALKNSLQVEKCLYLHRELLFISSSRFKTVPNLFNCNIFDEFIVNKLYLSWLKSFTVEINKLIPSHLGLLTRVEWSHFSYCKIATWVDSSPSQWLDSLQHWHIVVSACVFHLGVQSSIPAIYSFLITISLQSYVRRVLPVFHIASPVVAQAQHRIAFTSCVKNEV